MQLIYSNVDVYPTDVHAQQVQIGNTPSEAGKGSQPLPAHTLGMCAIVNGRQNPNVEFGCGLDYIPALLDQFPAGWADEHLDKFPQESPQKDWFFNTFIKQVTIDVVRQPERGKLKMTNEDYHLAYVPDVGYRGKDLVEYIARGKGPDGKLIAVRVASDARYKRHCKTALWKLSAADESLWTVFCKFAGLSSYSERYAVILRKLGGAPHPVARMHERKRQNFVFM